MKISPRKPTGSVADQQEPAVSPNESALSKQACAIFKPIRSRKVKAIGSNPAKQIGSEVVLCAQNGDTVRMQALITQGVNIEVRSMRGHTPLIDAVINGHDTMVKVLLAAGAQPNARDRVGKTALMHAVERNRMSTVELLLDAGVDMDVRSPNGWSAITCAAKKGYVQIVSLLIAKGADVNIQSNIQQTPLLYAARGGHLEVVRLLLNAKANVNCQDQYGWTALMRAVSGFYYEIVDLLLANQADVTLKMEAGRTALMIADINRSTRLVNTLLKAGADSRELIIIVPEPITSVAVDCADIECKTGPTEINIEPSSSEYNQKELPAEEILEAKVATSDVPSPTNMLAVTTIEEQISIARAHFMGMSRKSLDEIGQALHIEVSLLSPMGAAYGKADVLAASANCFPMFNELTVRTICGTDNHVMVAYRLECPNAPRYAAALLTFEGSLIRSIEVFYGRSEMISVQLQLPTVSIQVQDPWLRVDEAPS